MNSILRNIGKGVYYLVIVLFIVILANNFLTKSDRLFKLIGYRSYTILTGSMEPKIMPGDLIIIKSVNPDTLVEGDVITFNHDNKVVTHRIVSEKNNGFITKGDNNNVEDVGVVARNQVIGKVVTVIPKIGYLIFYISKPIVISVMLILMAIWIIWDMVIKEDNKEKNK